MNVKMMQVEFDAFTLVIWPRFGKEGLVSVFYRGTAPAENYSIPQFLEILKRVRIAKEKDAS